VDNLVVRLPTREVVQAIRRHGKLNLVVVDGAQAVGHIPLSLADDDCDLFLAGSHKWLRAYYPLGFAVFRRRLAHVVNNDVRALLERYRMDDPLTRFTSELETGFLSRYGETVNLLPLFTCQAALDDALRGVHRLHEHLAQRIRNADRLIELAGQNWRPVRPAPALRTGICLLRAKDPSLTRVCPSILRERLHGSGLAVTTYERGLVRCSMPDSPWTESEASLLSDALELQRVYV
jgi:selenocysteine lyase/cysteine desulfurase